MDSVFSKVTHLLQTTWGKLLLFSKARELEIKSITFSSAELTLDIGRSNQKQAAYHLTLQQIASSTLYKQLDAKSKLIVTKLRIRQKQLNEMVDS